MDRTKVEEFLDRFIGFASGATTIGLLAVADRSGLSAYLASSGRGSAAEIARGAGLEERYVVEIMSGLAAAGVVEYDAATEQFSLPPEHALFIASESSPYFMGGFFDMIPAAFAQIDGVADATIRGGGVPYDEFGPAMAYGIDRGSSPSHRAFLISRWLPGVPGLTERLEAGIRVADVGCGTGTAAVLMASAYPNSHVVGFDVSADSLDVAGRRGGHLANLEFHEHSADDFPIDPRFDLITTFDVIHDLSAPLDGLGHIREALSDDGMYLMMEPRASSNLEDNLTPRGALLYGISALHCMTQSLAGGGAGLGAAWGRQQAEAVAEEAGFGLFQALDEISNRFSSFYLLKR